MPSAWRQAPRENTGQAGPGGDHIKPVLGAEPQVTRGRPVHRAGAGRLHGQHPYEARLVHRLHLRAVQRGAWRLAEGAPGDRSRSGLDAVRVAANDFEPGETGPPQSFASALPSGQVFPVVLQRHM